MTNVPFFQIDAFAEKPFEGNPAAVCLLPADLEGPADSAWAQAVAREMNLSETAFVGPLNPQGERTLRWFTPTVEVDLCGHATLAAAHALWELDGVEAQSSVGDSIVFHTRSGNLVARNVAAGGRLDQTMRTVELDFPARPARRSAPPADLLEALGMAARGVAISAEGDVLVEVDSVAFVVELEPDLDLLATVPGRGFIVTAAVRPEDDEVPLRGGVRPDFVSRFFAPSCGVAEDPVTGSAHCTLAPFWGKRMRKDRLLAYQASPRGGFLGLALNGDRVHLSGGAVTIVSGELRCPPA